MKSIAVNDIQKPLRITVTSRDQLLKVIRGAHHVKDAIEIYFDGVECIYYICPWTELNAGVRKLALSRAAGLLQRNTPKNFNEKLRNNIRIPSEVFREVVV